MQAFIQIVKLIENGKNLFITGSAGSGKSFLLQKLKIHFGKDIALTASTGIAAINIGGMTIHSFAKLGIGNEEPSKIADKILKDPKACSRILKCKILAIDEISMLSSFMLKLLDRVFKAVRNNLEPFGGITVIFFGDFLQLPPVLKNEDETICLKCNAWNEAEIKTILLTSNYRHKDDTGFFNILQSIRMGENLQEAFSALQARVNVAPPENTIKLVSHREQALILNNKKLASIPYKEVVFKAQVAGKDGIVSAYSKNFQDFMELSLKKGARVMLNWNLNVEAGLCNGSIGNIIDFSPRSNMPIVQFDGHASPVKVSTNDFKIEDTLTSEVIFSFSQVPLQLAYGLTIHKSQGLTFDNIETDISKCFAEGQAYVSLSRAKTLNGLFLKSFDISVLKANLDIANYYKNLEEEQLALCI